MTDEEEKEFVETWTNNFLKMYGVQKTEEEKNENTEAEKTQEPKSVKQNTTRGEIKMKFCQNCGSQLQEGAKFCPNCGTPAGQVANVNADMNANQNTNNTSVRKQEFVGTIRKCPSCGTEVPAFAVTCPSCGHELNRDKVDKSVKEFFDKLADYSTGYESASDEKKAEKSTVGRNTLFLLAPIIAWFGCLLLLPDFEDIYDNPKLAAIILFILALSFIFFGLIIKSPLTQQQKQKRNLIETFIVPNNKESVIEFLLLSCSQIQTGSNPITKEGKNVSLWNKVWKTKIKQTIAKSNILFASDKDAQEKVKAIRKQYKV